MNRAVYIGAGLDILPIIVCSNIKQFIYIDSLPKSEYGTFWYNTEQGYDKQFLDRLMLIMSNNNFRCIKQSKTIYEFENGDRNLKYFINTAFPDHITGEIAEYIRSCNTLILSGFCPHKVILEYMPNLHTVIGNTHTVYIQSDADYEDDEQKSNSVFEYLIHNKTVAKQYVLLKEKHSYQYWNYDNMLPSMGDIYDMIDVADITQFLK